MTDNLPIPGFPLPGRGVSTVSGGSCSSCAAPVVFALDRANGADGGSWFAPLEPTPRPSVQLPLDMVWVSASPSGETSVISPLVFRRHRCAPEDIAVLLSTVTSQGLYSLEVLAVSCPVRSCGAAPGTLCMSNRRDAQPHPHGARVVFSRGEDLDADIL